MVDGGLLVQIERTDWLGSLQRRIALLHRAAALSRRQRGAVPSPAVLARGALVAALIELIF